MGDLNVCSLGGVGPLIKVIYRGDGPAWTVHSIQCRRLAKIFMHQRRAKIMWANFLSVLCFFVAVGASWQNPKTAEEYNNRGLDRQNSGDLDGAIATKEERSRRCFG
jgi:hypothetical protein